MRKMGGIGRQVRKMGDDGDGEDDMRIESERDGCYESERQMIRILGRATDDGSRVESYFHRLFIHVRV